MSLGRVLVTRRWPQRVEARVAELFDATLSTNDVPLTADQLKQAMTQYDVLMPTVTDAITADILSVEGRTVRMVGNFGVGFNNIDIKTARHQGIVVSNTPDVLTDCTADIAMSLVLMVARRLSEGERHLRAGEWTGWRPTHMMGCKVTGKKLALVGFGRIAQAVARKAHHGFGMEIMFFDPFVKDTDAGRDVAASQCDNLPELLKWGDFISIHCPSTEGTRGLMDALAFATMGKDSFLINTARGDIVDEAALVTALKDGVIAGAGLDVYENEPTVSRGLLRLDNVVLLPHLGSASTETREAMGMRVVENVQAFLQGEEIRDRVA